MSEKIIHLREIAEAIKSWTYDEVREEGGRLANIASVAAENGDPPFAGTKADFAELLNDWADSIIDLIDDEPSP